MVTYGRIRFVAEALVGKVGRFVGVGGVASYRGYMDAYALFPPGLKVAVPEDAPVVDSEEELRFAYLIAQTEQAVLDTPRPPPTSAIPTSTARTNSSPASGASSGVSWINGRILFCRMPV